MSNDKAIAVVRQYLDHASIQENFARVLGNERRARSFAMSVLLAVANSDALQKCTPPSIYTSSMRAALLGLSVDPSTKQAYLVPFGAKCTLIVGYKGLLDMAVRTGKYRWINDREIYAGEKWVEDPASGMLSLEGAPVDKKDENIIGWYSGFQLFDGLIKQIQMTVGEIHEHGKRYSKSYGNSDSAWKTNPREMERKTILRRLLSRYGYLDPADKQMLDEADEAIDAPEIPMNGDAPEIHVVPNSDLVHRPEEHGVPEKPGLVQRVAETFKPKKTVAEINDELGYAGDGRKRAPQSKDDEASYFAFTDTLMTRAHAEKILEEVGGDCFQAYNAVLRMGKPVAAK